MASIAKGFGTVAEYQQWRSNSQEIYSKLQAEMGWGARLSLLQVGVDMEPTEMQDKIAFPGLVAPFFQFRPAAMAQPVASSIGKSYTLRASFWILLQLLFKKR